MTILKPRSVITGGVGVGDTAPCLDIIYPSSGHNVNQIAFESTDHSGVAITYSTDSPPDGSGVNFFAGGAFNNILTSLSGMRFYVSFTTPQGLSFPDGLTKQGIQLRAGTGDPSSTSMSTSVDETVVAVNTSIVGDLYWKRGTGHALKRCTISGTYGTWKTIV